MPPTTTTITSAAAASLAIPLSSKTKTRPPPAPPQPPRVLYRLAAVVCHYGQHSFGHYVCFRRKPRGSGRVVPPRLDEGPAAPPTGRGWLRVSDDAAREVGIETVLQEGVGVFMLYYERVLGEDGPGRSWTGPGLHAWEAGGASDSDGSEEKTRPVVVVDGAAKTHEPREEEQEKVVQDVVAGLAAAPSTTVIKARVVRSVSLGPDEVLRVGGSSVKRRETQAEVVDPDEEVEEPAPSATTPAVGLPLTASGKVLSPIPEPPPVDEPPISLPRTVDLRA